jgi:hypothetical protein
VHGEMACEAAVSHWEGLSGSLNLRLPRRAEVTLDREEDGYDDDRDGAV